MPALTESVRDYVFAQNLLARRDRVLVAVSGGLDSMVLLHLLGRLQSEMKLHIAVAHLNHCLRGRSSDADERLVRAAAKKQRLRCFVERIEVKKLASREKFSLEMAARKARHDFLANTARTQGFKIVALAHHADDQVELFFIRLFRGSGPEAVGGMTASGTSPASAGIRLIRPLLNQTRTALAHYATEHKIHFREDASNASTDILRNRIRHKLLPLLIQEYQPALQKAVLRTMELTRVESEFVRQSAKAWLEQLKSASAKPAAFTHLPAALQRQVILHQLYSLKVTPDFELVETLRNNLGTVVNTPGLKQSLRLESSGILVPSRASQAEFRSDKAQITLSHKRRNKTFGGLLLNWTRTAKWSSAPIKKQAAFERFDADKVGERIIVRHWQPGDRFQPIGMPKAVKLQDLFVNAKIPREQRCALVVATTARGEIFWVQGLRIGEKFKLTSATGRELHWSWTLNS